MHTSELIKYLPVSFTCPGCSQRNTYKLMYAGSHAKCFTACRCSNCEKTVLLKYRVRQTEKGQFKLNVLSCRDQKKWYRNKRYQITKIPK